MAKDDYFVIVYKILAYLYVQLKAGEQIDPRLISADGYLCSVNDKYWTYIWVNLVDSGFVSGVSYERAWGKDVVISDLEDVQITPAGIEYLCENNRLKKVVEYLKDVKAITPFI
ncbi:YjcQ family protein [Ileibacterium valens]|uniref:YjcQ family protein n=1 Tax=Ileibacterium valens TaxID=1862668 RepID=UPI003513BB46